MSESCLEGQERTDQVRELIKLGQVKSATVKLGLVNLVQVKLGQVDLKQVGQVEWDIFSNSTPTCKPNTTLFSHGRRKKKEGRKNPHLACSRSNDPTCLKLVDCLVGVWRVYGKCLEGVWHMS